MFLSYGVFLIFVSICFCVCVPFLLYHFVTPRSAPRSESDSKLKPNVRSRTRKRTKNKMSAPPPRVRDETVGPGGASDMPVDESNLKSTTNLKLKRCREESRDMSPTNKKHSPNPKERKDCSHPIYKKISLKNGEINRMTHKELQSTLTNLKLDDCGFPDVLRKRLKMHFTNKSLNNVGLNTPQMYDYICVIDFEATCQRENPPDYLHEIIEFPIVLVNTKTRQIEDSFMSFCKPLLNPKLTDFCTNLTNITQTQVDYADTFPVVLERANSWMKEKELGSKYKYAIATDGPWDMNLFMRVQCKLSQVQFPTYAKKWINISKSFSNFYKTNRLKLELMLKNLGYQFEGRPHRGIDDAKNIARVALKLMEDGCTLEINDRLT